MATPEKTEREMRRMAYKCMSDRGCLTNILARWLLTDGCGELAGGWRLFLYVRVCLEFGARGVADRRGKTHCSPGVAATGPGACDDREAEGGGGKRVVQCRDADFKGVVVFGRGPLGTLIKQALSHSRSAGCSMLTEHREMHADSRIDRAACDLRAACSSLKYIWASTTLLFSGRLSAIS